MAAAKKDKAAETLPVLAKRAPERYQAIVAISDLASKFTDGDAAPVATVTADNIDKGVEVLARVREANRNLDALYDEAVDEFKKKISGIESERNKLRKKLAAADTAVADRIIEVYKEVSDKGALEKRMEGAMGSTATVSYRSIEVEIEDAKAIPDKFIRAIPSREERVDTAAIAAALKAGEKVPGVKGKPKYFLTTRVAELVEKA